MRTGFSEGIINERQVLNIVSHYITERKRDVDHPDVDTVKPDRKVYTLNIDVG